MGPTGVLAVVAADQSELLEQPDQEQEAKVILEVSLRPALDSVVVVVVVPLEQGPIRPPRWAGMVVVVRLFTA